MLTDADSFASLEHEWNELWDTVKGAPSQHFRYYLHALREIAVPAGARLHCLVGRKDGRLVFGWPLVRSRERMWTSVRPLTPDPSELSEPLVAHGDNPRSMICAAWRALLASCRGDVLSLPMVRTDSALYGLASSERSVSQGERRVVRVAPLTRYNTWTEYRGGLPTVFRKELDYQHRRLQRAGKAAISIADLADPASAAYVSAMLEWKRQWARRTDAQGDFFKDAYQAFLRKALSDPSLARTLRLFVLSLDGHAIAVNLVAVSDASVIGMQAAFDPAFSKLSPGLLLLEHVAKWTFENGRELDFGPGDNKYKSNWTGDCCYTCVDFRIALSRWGRTDLAARAVRKRWEGLRVRFAARS